jgi:hypothetical protein
MYTRGLWGGEALSMYLSIYLIYIYIMILYYIYRYMYICVYHSNHMYMHTCTMKYMIYTYNAPPDVLLDPCVCGMAADPYADRSAFSPAHKPDQPPHPPPDGPHHSPHRPSYCGETGALLDMYPMQCTHIKNVILERSGLFLATKWRAQKLVPLSLCMMCDSGPNPFPYCCPHHGTSVNMSLTRYCISRVNIMALIPPFRHARDTHIPRTALLPVSLAWHLYSNYRVVICPRAQTVFHLGVTLHLCSNPCGVVIVASGPFPLVSAYTHPPADSRVIPLPLHRLPLPPLYLCPRSPHSLGLSPLPLSPVLLLVGLKRC